MLRLPEVETAKHVSPQQGDDTPDALRIMPRIVSVGDAVPPTSYSQQDIIDMFGVQDPTVRSLFLNSTIESRHLILPADGPGRDETQNELLEKHVEWGVMLAREAITASLRSAGAAPRDVRHLLLRVLDRIHQPGA